MDKEKLVQYTMPEIWARVLSDLIMLESSVEFVDEALGENEGTNFATKIHTGAVEVGRMPDPPEGSFEHFQQTEVGDSQS